MTQYEKINTIRKLAKKLGVELDYADLNTHTDGDVTFVYRDGSSRYYKNAETGFEREEERLSNFLRVAETIDEWR